MQTVQEGLYVLNEQQQLAIHAVADSVNRIVANQPMNKVPSYRQLANVLALIKACAVTRFRWLWGMLIDAGLEQLLVEVDFEKEEFRLFIHGVFLFAWRNNLRGIVNMTSTWLQLTDRIQHEQVTPSTLGKFVVLAKYRKRTGISKKVIATQLEDGLARHFIDILKSAEASRTIKELCIEILYQFHQIFSNSAFAELLMSLLHTSDITEQLYQFPSLDGNVSTADKLTLELEQYQEKPWM